MKAQRVHALRELPEKLVAERIKVCAYQFNVRSSGETDIDIDEASGAKVLLRSSSQADLERDYELLLRILEETRGAQEKRRDRFLRVLPRQSAPNQPTFRPEALLGSSVFLTAPDGRLALRGPAAELYDALDLVFRAFARRYDAEAFHAEPIWHRKDLAAFGYGEESPHLFRVSHLGGEAPGYFQNAVCDNIWKYHAGLVLRGAPRVVTARGVCCRYEGKQHFALEYLRAFTMREVVMAGSPSALERFRDDALDFVATLATDLELPGRFEEANDPFFLAGGSRADGAAMLPDLVKIELRLPLYDDRTLACASFNIHGDFFSKAFRYRNEDDDDPVWTGCVAFGIERWIWAILCRHGPDPSAWPARLRDLAGVRA